MLDKKVIIYLDDILVYNKTKEEHFKDLEEVFRRLQQNRLITKGSKCEFLKPELEFLGHVVSGDGIKIDPRKVLRLADPSRPFEVITDASDFTIGAVLLQDFGKGLQPIAYESRKMQPPERNYPIHDKEMLAIVHAFRVWRCYLTGADVAIRTDHKSLQYLRSQPTLNPRQIRFFKTLHQRTTTPHGKYYLKAGTNRIWVPAYQPLRQLLTQEVHDSNLSGHFGIDKTLKLLQRNYYWPDMLTDVQRYVTTCPTCQAMKSLRQRPAGLLQPLEPPERPWQQVTMDFVT
ncbi:unnamed protein product [Closterium sp. NIES-54]